MQYRRHVRVALMVNSSFSPQPGARRTVNNGELIAVVVPPRVTLPADAHRSPHRQYARLQPAAISTASASTKSIGWPAETRRAASNDKVRTLHTIPMVRTVPRKISGENYSSDLLISCWNQKDSRVPSWIRRMSRAARILPNVAGA